MKEIEGYWNDLKTLLRNIDREQFHFLRPHALYLFVPLAVIVLLLIISNKGRRKWQTIVAGPLRKYMFSKSSPFSIIWPLFFFIAGMSAMITGLAGPAWKKKEIPGEKVQAVVLIALDLSKSMLAADIQPSRLERAKFKVNDFMDANPRARAGLLAFAGTAHPVLPFTSDYKIVKFHTSSLVNRMMPVQGSSIEMLLVEINDMMKNVAAPGTVLLLTDAIGSDDAGLLSRWVESTIHRLEIILISSPAGGTIPGYRVLSKQDPSVIQNLAQNPKIIITPLTLDNSDVRGVANRISSKLTFQRDKKQDDKEWDDMGWLLIIPAALITALWFRKGWVIQWCLLPLLFFSLPGCGLKSRHPDWWYSKDYQGQLLADAKDYPDAAERFENEPHKAAAYYKAGNFDAAADLYSIDSSAAGKYNLGLSLVKLGRYGEAEEAFNAAARLDPSLRERAEKSIAKTRLAERKTDSIMRYDPALYRKKAEKLAEQKKKYDLAKARQQAAKKGKAGTDTGGKQDSKSGGQKTGKVTAGIGMVLQESSKPGLKKPDNSQQQAAGIVMRRADADPVEFLHKRFLLQQRHSTYKIKKSKTPW